MSWPEKFSCVPEEEWAVKPLEELAMKYDTVEEHGWYDNLDFTVSTLSKHHTASDIILDYSGGTGILTARLMRAMKEKAPHVLIVDSSPKFLRLSLEKFCTENRVGFRLIRYLRQEKRLQNLSEVIDDSIWKRGVDGIVSTNAIHLYYQLPDTLKSWKDLLKPGGVVHVQSGNIRNPAAGDSTWIIDETVDHINAAAIEIVKNGPGFDKLREYLKDKEHMKAHDILRKKYFLPVRPLDHYIKALEQSGLSIQECEWKPIKAEVDEWYDFLAVYHEGVLGWVGGAQKITGRAAKPHDVSLRKALMRLAMEKVFNGKDHFLAAWTYITAIKPEH